MKLVTDRVSPRIWADQESLRNTARTEGNVKIDSHQRENFTKRKEENNFTTRPTKQRGWRLVNVAD